MSDETTALYRTKMNKAASMQLTAYYLAVGPSLFAKGPYQLLQQFVFQADFKQLNSYLALARGEVGLLMKIVRLFDPKQQLGYMGQLVNNIYELRLWIYSTQINVSGLLADAQSQQGMKMSSYDERHQRELTMTPGFLFPSQVATLMQCETEDLMAYAAPAFVSIFGSVMANRYPSAACILLHNALATLL